MNNEATKTPKQNMNAAMQILCFGNPKAAIQGLILKQYKGGFRLAKPKWMSKTINALKNQNNSKRKD